MVVTKDPGRATSLWGGRHMGHCERSERSVTNACNDST